jgi:hypothetical protein
LRSAYSALQPRPAFRLKLVATLIEKLTADTQFFGQTGDARGLRYPAHRFLLEIYAVDSLLLLLLLLRPAPLWPINVPDFPPLTVSQFWGALQ